MERYEYPEKESFFCLERPGKNHPTQVLFKSPSDIVTFQVFMRACYYTTFTAGKGRGIDTFELHPIPGVSAEQKRQALDKLLSRMILTRTKTKNVYKMGPQSPLLRSDELEGRSFIKIERRPEFFEMVTDHPEALRLELYMRFKSFVLEGQELCRLPVSRLSFISWKKARTALEFLEEKGVVKRAENSSKTGKKVPMTIPIPKAKKPHGPPHSCKGQWTVVKLLTKAVCEERQEAEVKERARPGARPGVEQGKTQGKHTLEGSTLEGREGYKGETKTCPSPDLATDEPPSLTEDLPTSSVDLPAGEARPSAGPTSEQFSVEYVASLPPVGHCVQAEANLQDSTRHSPATPAASADASSQAEANSPDCPPADARAQDSSTSYPAAPAGGSSPPTPVDAGLQDSPPASPTQVQSGRSSEADLVVRTSRLLQKLDVLPHLDHDEYWSLWRFLHMCLAHNPSTSSRDLNEMFHLLHKPDYSEVWVEYFDQLVRDQNTNFNPGSLGGRYSKVVGEEMEQLLGSSEAYTHYIRLKHYLFPGGELELERRWKHQPDPEAWAEMVLEGCRKQMNEPFSPARVEVCAMRLLCEQQEWRRAGAVAQELQDRLTASDSDLQNAVDAFALRFRGVRPKHKRGKRI